MPDSQPPTQPEPSAQPTHPQLPASADSASNTFGKFVRTEKLGAGGMGEVWKAWDRDLARWVALKFLKGGDDVEILRFTREAQTAARLAHPNIAAIYEVGEANARRYIAMQYVEGRTLKAHRSERREQVRIVRDAARAVQYAHDHGIVHRDIKPENLMVTPAGHVFVMDFGLARTVEGERSVSGAIVGTPAYMPPEQARGEKVDARADVYSLGATLYEEVAGRAPFAGGNAYEVLRKLQDYDPATLSGVEPDLETIVLKCLEKDRGRRYASAGDLADDLDRWLAGEPVAARRASIGYRLRKRLAKRKALVAVAAAGVLGVAVLVGLLGRERSRQEAMLELWSRVAKCLSDAEAYDRAAEVDAARRRRAEGVALCEAFLRDREYAHARFVLARLFRAQKDGDRALQELDRALALEPGMPEARALRGLVLVDRYRARYEEDVRRTGLRGRAAGTSEELEAVRPELRDLRLRAVADLRATPGPSVYFSEAERLLGQGLLAWLQGDPAGGERLLLRAVEVEPLCAEALLAVTYIAKRANDRRRAIELATRALRVHRGLVEAYYLRGWMRTVEGELDSGIADLTEAIRLDPRHVHAHLSRARARMLGDDLAAAIGDCDAVLVIDPRSTEALVERGNLHGFKRDFDRAHEDFAAAIAIDPDAMLAYMNRGAMLLQQGDAGGALKDFEAVVRIAPEFQAGWENRGIARVMTGDCRGAIEDLDRALTSRTDATEAVSWRAEARLQLGEHERALEDAERAIALDPRLGRGWRVRGAVRMRKGRLREAAGDVKQAVELNPRDGMAWLYFGLVHYQAGDRVLAREGFDRAVELSARDPQAWYNRGIVRAEQGDGAGAIADYGRAIQLKPDFDFAYINRALLKFRGGDAAGAEEDTSRALAVRPSHMGHATRGFAREKLGDREGARADLEASLELAPEGWPGRASVEAALKRVRP